MWWPQERASSLPALSALSAPSENEESFHAELGGLRLVQVQDDVQDEGRDEVQVQYDVQDEEREKAQEEQDCEG